MKAVFGSDWYNAVYSSIGYALYELVDNHKNKLGEVATSLKGYINPA